MANTKLYQGSVFIQDANTGFYTSEDDDSVIIDKYGNCYDTTSGEFIWNVDTDSGMKSTGGGIWGSLLDTLGGIATDPNTIKGIVNNLIGAGTLPTTVPHSSVPPTTPTVAKSNSTLYIIIGLVLVAGIGGVVYYSNKK